jgi:cystathionine gamma-synthase
VSGVVTCSAGGDALKAFWQHTGLIVSTRQAAALLAGQQCGGDLPELRGSLRRHPKISQIWYPKWSFGDAYESVRRPDGGWGSLVTFLPKDAENSAPRIYDHLAVCKGPSLGTDFTLACPFTLLAHYTELEWAEACGVPRYLIRISVGLEDPDELWQRLESALQA